jgi:hypothetical protein
MKLDWYCTGVLGMKQQSCWGVLWFFKRPRVSPLERQRNRQHDIWCLITNTGTNRGEIVCSLITKIFNPCKHWTVTIQPSVLYVQWISVYSYFLPVFSCSSVVRFSFFLFCRVWFNLFDYSVLEYLLDSVFFCLMLEFYSRYFDPHNKNHPASQ